ncbi:MAG: DUF1223 domain-containing protein [Acidobacteria bacterium]|nr:DUF1223 domain-containing protein [Acidobacteriota bacterium]
MDTKSMLARIAIGGLLSTVAVILFLQPDAVAEFEEPSAGSPAPRVPVIVELFTSEGCSSCPSADIALIELDEKQPVPGAEIIALGEHVDYWDRLGWKDRFSAAQFTDRQGQYADFFGNRGPYTPQMVVDGRAEFVGSDNDKARSAIVAAAREAKAEISLELGLANGDSVPLKIRVGKLLANGKESAEVILALTESKLINSVRSGENEGRTLRHTAVVRRMEIVGTIKAGQSEAYTGQTSIKIAKDWKRENLRAVVFVQDQKTWHVLAAGAIPMRAD